MEFIIGDMARIQKGDTFGGRLTEAREEVERWDGKGYGYTQAELVALLAERCEVSIGRSYLSELERSWQQDKMPSLEVAAALVDCLRVNLSWLAGLSDNKEPENADADLAWSPTSNAIANTVDKWPEQARQAMLSVVRALVPFVAGEQDDVTVAPDDANTIGDQSYLFGRLNSGSANQGDEQPQARSKRKARR